MPVRSRIKVLLAERNLERVRAGARPISVRQLAEATGITHSALVKGEAGASSILTVQPSQAAAENEGKQPVA